MDIEIWLHLIILILFVLYISKIIYYSSSKNKKVKSVIFKKDLIEYRYFDKNSPPDTINYLSKVK